MEKSTIWTREKINEYTKAHARQMRKNPTPAEQQLWEQLRNNKPSGAKFRRQQPLAGFILDFYCDKFKLCVEADGEIHSDSEQFEYDKSRDAYLKEMGILTLRFKNAEIESDMHGVLKTIKDYLK